MSKSKLGPLNRNTIAIITLLSIASMSFSAPLINGISVHSQLGEESFIGALFTTTLSNNARNVLVAQEEKQIQVRMLADRMSARRFRRMWIEGMAVNAVAKELEEQSKSMAAFSNMLKVTLRKGDIFVIQRTNEDVIVQINGAKLGTIDDPQFFDLLLRAWIGPVPLSSSFRTGLLLGGNIDQALMSRFNQTLPTDQRIREVSIALQRVNETNQEKTPVPIDPSLTPKIQPNVITKPEITAPVIANKTPPLPARSDTGISDDLPPVKPVEKQADTGPVPEDIQLAKADPTPPQSIPETAAPAAASNIPSDDVLKDIIEEDEDFTAESLLKQQLYIAKLKKWTYKELRYPILSLDKNEEGLVRLLVTLFRDGKVKNVEILEKPKYNRLTKAAVKAVKKSSPFPAMPKEVNGEEFEFSLPIVFRIAD